MPNDHFPAGKTSVLCLGGDAATWIAICKGVDALFGDVLKHFYLHELVYLPTWTGWLSL